MQRNFVKFTLLLLFIAIHSLLFENQAKAELKIDLKKLLNSITNEDKNKDVDAETQAKPTGQYNNELNLKLGGFLNFQYFHTNQRNMYEREMLPNGLTYNPTVNSNWGAKLGSNQNMFNILGQVDIQPEFVLKKFKEQRVEGQEDTVLKVGAKLSKSWYKASTNTDPTIKPNEYVYVETKFFRFELGAVNSSASRLRVDAQKLASGNGGVYGTWWNYVQWPVFNTSGMSAMDAMALNAMTPAFIVYPTLPNEAGFTTQRFLVGQRVSSSNFVGENVNNNIMYGSVAQGYPTQGAYSNKISLYNAKRIYGFKFGFSYSPTTANTGALTKMADGNTWGYNSITGGHIRDYMSFALDWRKSWDNGFSIAMSITHEIGRYENAKYIGNGTFAVPLSPSAYYARKNLNATAYGIQLSYKNWSIAYSFGDWRRSLLPVELVVANGQYQVANQGRHSYYHSAGIGVHYGPINAGITYMNSNMAGNILNALSFGTDVKLISKSYMRAVAYAELTWYQFDPKTVYLRAGDTQTHSAKRNEGVVVIVGIKTVF